MHRFTVTAAPVSVSVLHCPPPCSGHHPQVTVVPNSESERDGRNRHVGECQFPVPSQHSQGSLSLARHSYEYHLTLRSGLTPPAVLLKLLRVRPQHSELSRPDSEVEFPNDCARACLLCWWDGALAGPSLTDVHSWAVSTVKVGGYPSHAS